MRRITGMILWAAACGVLPVQLLRAQATPDDTPQAIAQRLLTAQRQHDWRTLYRWGHPAAFEAFKRAQLSLFSPQQAAIYRRLDSVSGQHFGATIARERQRLLDSVYHLPSLDALAQTPADTLVRRLLAQWEHAPEEPDSSQMHTTVIGQVVRDSMAYVVIEETPPRTWLGESNEHHTFHSVMVFRRYGSEWRSMLEGPVDLKLLASLQMLEGSARRHR